MADSITRLFRACDPSESLKPDDPRYVNCDAVRGEHVVQIYERSLRRAQKPEVKLFAGHRGIGKTSELLRPKDRLENSTTGDNRPFQVVYFDVGEGLDVNDLDLPDLLVLIAAEVQKQLKAAKIPGFTPTSLYLSRVWDEICTSLQSEVVFKDDEFETPFGKLTLELRNRPNKRSVLRSAIEKHSTSLLDAINDFLDSATLGLNRAGRAGLTLIVDGLDKLVRRPLPDGQGNTHDRLFIYRSEQLASLHAHTIYTVPISLFYSPRCAALEQSLGEHNLPVSMIKLRAGRTEEINSNSAGMETLRTILTQRCTYAKIGFEDAFDAAETANYLCKMTGGHPRHLMMFVQGAINTIDALPITMEAARKAVGNYKNSLLREIPSEDWRKLAQFDLPQADIPKDDAHQEMLFLLYVFEYMNGEPWYEVNLVIRELPQFRQDS